MIKDEIADILKILNFKAKYQSNDYIECHLESNGNWYTIYENPLAEPSNEYEYSVLSFEINYANGYKVYKHLYQDKDTLIYLKEIFNTELRKYKIEELLSTYV